MRLIDDQRETDVGQGEVGHSELVTEVRSVLAELPGAADLVIGHVFCGEPLPVMAQRLRIPLTEAPALLRRSLELLRPVMAGTEFAPRG